MRLLTGKAINGLSDAPIWVELTHNLPASDYWVVQFVGGGGMPLTIVVSDDGLLSFVLSSIDSNKTYRLVAFPMAVGMQRGVWWVESYRYDPGQRNIKFVSQGGGDDSGPAKSITSTITVNGQPAQRTVVAMALDGDSPRVLGLAQSDASGQYTVSWQGYTGQVLLTAMDDYGVPHVPGEVRGVGERIHPSSPNGYVYEVVSAGTLGVEPVWPTEAGVLVVSGSVHLTAKPFYRPKTHGPVTVI